jgi:hypothetical protein
MSSSLRQLFEDAQGVEENICASRRIREWVEFENLHAHEQGNCKYISNFQQENSECESDLGQQQGCKYVSNYESDSSMIADVSMNRYACQIQEKFSNNVEDEIVDDCIDNYMFLIDQNPYDVNLVFSSSCENYSKEEVVMIDDQDMIIRE